MPPFRDENMPDWRDIPMEVDSSRKEARPCAPEVASLAEAMLAVGEARDRLEKAKERARGTYYGYSPDLVAWEQDDFNRAAECFADAIVAVVAAAGVNRR